MKPPLSTGDTYGDIVAWTWDRSGMRFVCELSDCTLTVQFHKVGGRWSKTYADGTPNPHPDRCYWTIALDTENWPDHTKYKSADEAKIAIIARYNKRIEAKRQMKKIIGFKDTVIVLNGVSTPATIQVLKNGALVLYVENYELAVKSEDVSFISHTFGGSSWG